MREKGLQRQRSVFTILKAEDLGSSNLSYTLYCVELALSLIDKFKVHMCITYMYIAGHDSVMDSSEE